jgi:hydroxymethylbilane synthase
MTGYIPKIGARGSPLSLAQTGLIRRRLATLLGCSPNDVPLLSFVTSGDKQQEGRLLDAGGKGLFTKELDEALLDGRIDLAVHSLKDVPTKLSEGIMLASVPEREDPRDAFLSPHATRLEDLPQGAVLGTASLRRQAQSLFVRRDLKVKVLRGNVETRLRKLAEGDADATYLALAGLKRLGLEGKAAGLVDPQEAPPAPCQGALGITARADDAVSLTLAAQLEDPGARVECEIERAFLDALEGSCRTPIGALGQWEKGHLHFIGEALAPDGSLRWRRMAHAHLAATDHEKARALGIALAISIKTEAGDALKS